MSKFSVYIPFRGRDRSLDYLAGGSIYHQQETTRSDPFVVQAKSLMSLPLREITGITTPSDVGILFDNSLTDVPSGMESYILFPRTSTGSGHSETHYVAGYSVDAGAVSLGKHIYHGDIEITNDGVYIILGKRYYEGQELDADAAAPATNKGRLYFKDNGAGKTQLVVRFPTGAVQVIATEP